MDEIAKAMVVLIELLQASETERLLRDERKPS
jgi:hypothetical protein